MVVLFIRSNSFIGVKFRCPLGSDLSFHVQSQLILIVRRECLVLETFEFPLR